MDSCVFIDAWRGTKSHASQALDLFSDTERQFVGASLVRLELLPGPTYHRQVSELAFLRTLLSAISEWVELDESLVEEAIEIGANMGAAGADALHLAAARRAKVDQFVTSESATKPMFRFSEIRVLHVASL